VHGAQEPMPTLGPRIRPATDGSAPEEARSIVLVSFEVSPCEDGPGEPGSQSSFPRRGMTPERITQFELSSRTAALPEYDTFSVLRESILALSAEKVAPKLPRGLISLLGLPGMVWVKSLWG
jgi:hypothetical protein